MSSPRVSVLMPVRNQARFLPQAIESVLSQQYTDFELLASDNASDDDTPAVLQRYAQRDSRLRWTRNSTNIGITANWNSCLQQANGDYIKFLCGDDLLTTPDALGKLVASLDQNKSAALAISARRCLDEQSGRTRILNDFRDSGIYPGRDAILRCLRETHNLIGEPSAALFRRTAAGGGFNPAFRQLMDLELWFRLLENGDLAYCAEPLCVFRQHPEQASVSHNQSRVGEQDYTRLISEWLSKDWVRQQSDHDLIFRQARWCRRRRDCGEETAQLADRLYSELGRTRYALCWGRYKLKRLFRVTA